MLDPVKRHKLIYMKINEFKDFILENQEDIRDCSINWKDDFYSFCIDPSGVLKNFPSGGRNIKIHVQFNPPCSENNRNSILEAVDEFVKNFQRSLMKDEIDIINFAITFAIDSFVELEMYYRRKQSSRRNQNESLMDMIALYAKEVEVEELK